MFPIALFYGSLCDSSSLSPVYQSIIYFATLLLFFGFPMELARAFFIEIGVVGFFFRKKIDDALVPGVLETKREI